MSSETLRVTRRFQASAERIFDAWLDPSLASKFLFATPGGEMQQVDIDPSRGFRIVERRGGKDVAHVGRYLTVEPPRVLSFAFAAGLEGQLGGETTVRVEITPLAVGGSELMLQHDGVESAFVEQGERSWAMILANLDAIVRPDT